MYAQNTVSYLLRISVRMSVSKDDIPVYHDTYATNIDTKHLF